MAPSAAKLLRVREGWPGFLTGHPCPDQKGGDIVSPPPCGGLFVQPSPPAPRGPGRSRAEAHQRNAAAAPRALCSVFALIDIPLSPGEWAGVTVQYPHPWSSHPLHAAFTPTLVIVAKFIKANGRMFISQHTFVKHLSRRSELILLMRLGEMRKQSNG